MRGNKHIIQQRRDTWLKKCPRFTFKQSIPARSIRNGFKDRTIHRVLQTSTTGNHLNDSYHKYRKRQELQDERWNHGYSSRNWSVRVNHGYILCMTGNEKSPPEDFSSGGLILLSWWKKAVTYSPALHCSTIGASGLNFSVRNGKRWNPAAVATWYGGHAFTLQTYLVEEEHILSSKNRRIDSRNTTESVCQGGKLSGN